MALEAQRIESQVRKNQPTSPLHDLKTLPKAAEKAAPKKENKFAFYNMPVAECLLEKEEKTKHQIPMQKEIGCEKKPGL